MEQDELIQEMADIKSKMDEITQVQQEKAEGEDLSDAVDSDIISYS